MMIKRTPFVLSVLMFLALTSVDAAAATLVGPTSGATGINNLDIGGTAYNVRFSRTLTSYNDQFSGSTPAFLGDAAGAEAARDAILDFLSFQGVSGLTDLSPVDPMSGLSQIYGVPYSVTPTEVTYAAGLSPFDTTWFNQGSFTDDRNQQFVNSTWATFTVVPEPGSLTLLGLSGMIVLQRRRHRTVLFSSPRVR